MIEPVVERGGTETVGRHKIYRFNNGYGASVVTFHLPPEPPKCDLIIITFPGDNDLIYDIETSISFPWLPEGAVEGVLQLIKQRQPK